MIFVPEAHSPDELLRLPRDYLISLGHHLPVATHPWIINDLGQLFLTRGTDARIGIQIAGDIGIPRLLQITHLITEDHTHLHHHRI